jgi:UPF0755 protein
MPIDIQHFKRIHIGAAIGLFLLFFYISVSAPPKDYPKDKIVTVREGAGLFEVAQTLKDEGVIRNAAWFRTIIVLLGGTKRLQSGDYYLPYTQSVYAIAERIVRGDHEIARFKVTVPEGYTDKKIASLFDSRFDLFSRSDFLKDAEEGYMFPDTYFIGENATATSTEKLMRDNFDSRIFPLTGEIASSGHSLKDIVIMASIVQEEANTKEDMAVVAGILWKRLENGMPLQVDSTLTYINGKTSAEMTQGDLAFDSPYNTYVYKGLPPTPIGNPGLEALEATLRPSGTPYLYFLTGSDGRMYYARTFAEHEANIQKYIKP